MSLTVPDFMPKTPDPDELKYRALDLPWFFAHLNVYERVFELKEHVNGIPERLDTLSDFISSVKEQDRATRKEVSNVKMAIRDLMEHVEVIQYNLPHLALENWFTGFREDIAHAYWRVEDGKFDDASEDRDQLHSLVYGVRRIYSNTSESQRQGFKARLREHIEQLDWELTPSSPPESFKDEGREAGDLFCLGYYSTALIVLGRSVERQLLELGEERRIESVKAYDRSISWPDTKFFHKNVALNRADMPGEQGKVISNRQFHLISILIDYRNNVAHSEYQNVRRDKAQRQCKDAFDLLLELEEQKKRLDDMGENEIPPISDQKVQ